MTSSSIIRAMSCDSLLGLDTNTTMHVHRPALKEIVADFRKLVAEDDSECISSFRHHQLSGQNFAMAVIDEKGAKLVFPDDSVEVDVPPEALTHPQVVYCCRIDEEIAGVAPSESSVVFYSTILKLGATDKNFKQKIQLRFRHSAQLDSEEQKKRLAAFTQEEGAKLFRKEPSFELDVDEKFVTLRVDHFCNMGVGADHEDPAPLPPLRLLAMTFLVYVDITRRQNTALNLLIGKDDESHMKCLRNVVARRWKVGKSHIIRIDPDFKPFVCEVTSDLKFSFRPEHFQVEYKDKIVPYTEAVGNAFLVENTLYRTSTDGFESDAVLCSARVDDTSNGGTRRLEMNIKWESHDDMFFSQPEEKLFETRGEHAAVAERPIRQRPIEADPAHGFQVSHVDLFAGRFHLDVTKLQPSSQAQPHP